MKKQWKILSALFVLALVSYSAFILLRASQVPKPAQGFSESAYLAQAKNVCGEFTLELSSDAQAKPYIVKAIGPHNPIEILVRSTYQNTKFTVRGYPTGKQVAIGDCGVYPEFSVRYFKPRGKVNRDVAFEKNRPYILYTEYLSTERLSREDYLGGSRKYLASSTCQPMRSGQCRSKQVFQTVSGQGYCCGFFRRR